jgi:hypothetical protein
MARYICDLRAAEALDLVGGKGANLGRLVRLVLARQRDFPGVSLGARGGQGSACGVSDRPPLCAAADRRATLGRRIGRDWVGGAQPGASDVRQPG